MKTAYHFIDATVTHAPTVGSVVHAFRTKKNLQEFVKFQGKGWGAAKFKYFEITGPVLKDDGGKDGLEIRVNSYKEIRP